MDAGNPPAAAPSLPLPGRARIDRHAVWLPSAVALLIYARAGLNRWALDDKADVLENRFVSGPLDLKGIFTSEYYGGWGHLATGHYRPLLNLTYKIVAAIFGLQPSAYHLLNVLAFALIVALTVDIVRRVSGSFACGLLAGLLFAVHPINSESVAAIVGLKELGAAGFGLLAVWLYIRWRESDNFSAKPKEWWPALWGCAALLAGLLYKETALAFLPIALAAEFLHAHAPGELTRQRFLSRTVLCAPLAGAVAVALLARILVTGGLFRPSAVYSVDNPLVLLPGPHRFLASLSLLARYVGIYLWPACLSSDYSEGSFSPSVSPVDPWFLASVVWLAAFSAGIAWSLAKGRRAVAFGVIAFAASYALTSNLIVLIGTMMAERLFFVPSWALAVTLASALAPALFPTTGPWPPRGAMRTGCLVLLAFAVAGLAARCFARAGDWRNDETLVAAGARCYPRNVKVLVTQGNIEAERGNAQAAKAFYEKALSVRPDSAYAQAVLGIFLAKIGEDRRAEELLATSASSREPIPTAVVELARLYQKLGREDEAFRIAGKALETFLSYPDAALARIIRGEILLKRDDAEGAASEYRQAIEENPYDPRGYYNLGLCLESRGDKAGALSMYLKAEAIAPEDSRVLYSRALVEAGLGRDEDSLLTTDRLLNLHPDFLPGKEQRAAVLFHLGMLDLAVSEAEKVLKDAPESVTARFILGSVAEKRGNKAEARRHYEAILATPDLREDAAGELRRRLESLGG